MSYINVIVSKYGKMTQQISMPCTESYLSGKLGNITNDESETKFIVERISPKNFSFLEGRIVDLDELNYLAKYMDSLYDEEPQKLLVAAEHENIKTVKGLINLVFSPDRYTLIQSVKNLKEVGRKHYLTVHSGATEDEESLDLAKIGKDLLQSGKGIITEYGILFQNIEGALDEIYDGKVFPAYWYEGDTLYTVSMEYDGRKEYAYMPCEEMAIKKAFRRLGVDDPNLCVFETEQSEMSDDWDEMLKEYLKEKDLYKINRLLSTMQDNELNMDKLAALIKCANTDDLESALILAERINEFEYIHDLDTDEEVGRYMIDHSCEYELSVELEEFFDFDAFGEYFADEHNGHFVDGGFLYGDKSVEEILQNSNGPKMGGI